jgi:hypothetical protein
MDFKIETQHIQPISNFDEASASLKFRFKRFLLRGFLMTFWAWSPLHILYYEVNEQIH